jgi:hypothetical protein
MALHVNELEVLRLHIWAAKPESTKITELEWYWLESRHPVLAAGGASLQELWYAEFVINSAGAKNGLPFNSNAWWYLIDNGIASAPLSSMWYAFWLAGVEPT